MATEKQIIANSENALKSTGPKSKSGKTIVCQNFVHLRAQGYSYDKISTQLVISKPTLLKWGQESEKTMSMEKWLLPSEDEAQFWGSPQSDDGVSFPFLAWLRG